ncbi:hypothetical protein WBP06_26250 [Novosphingobium sp. BL-8H]|uniref:bestrophin-like domain n=1 Tax=Novosphingobium sp. BL-8H TaxID=3127640 RepID=UPI0037575C9B
MMDLPRPLFGLPILPLGIALLLVVIGLTWLGMHVGRRVESQKAAKTDDTSGDDDVNSAIVPAVLGLLALLLGFTFALAVDRFETRRGLVLEEANAIGTAYLQTQVLPPPNRERLSLLLLDYTDNRIRLAGTPNPSELRTELAKNDALINDIWAASLAGFDSIKHLDMSSTFLSSINSVIDLDTSRKTGRMAHVPDEVFWVLILYVMVAAVIIGYIIRNRASFYLACVMNVLVVLSLMLIMDIDRPTGGGIRESQLPMQMLSKSLHEEPRGNYDRWRTPQGIAGTD